MASRSLEHPSFLSGGGIDLKTAKLIHLAPSGDVSLNRLETEIVNTRDFQRLRRIRQLGTAHLVFPTALHTRFDHSLGVLAMAQDMISAIRENRNISDEERRITPEQEQILRLFALLHDIGHVPFGHTIEDEFRVFGRHDEDKERIERFTGGESAVGALIRGRLGADIHARLLAVFHAGSRTVASLGEDAFIYDLVNNTICADLLDYLRRDAAFCNMQLDLDFRFMRYLLIVREGGTRRAVVRLWKEGRPGPRRDTISELIRLLDNRYLMSERVYYHHAKLTSGAMVAGAVQRARLAGELAKEDLYELGDESLIDRLCGSREEPVRRLATAVRDRSLWKIRHERRRRDVEEEQARRPEENVLGRIMERFWRDADGRSAAEDRVARELGREAGDFLLHCPGAEMSMKVAEMKVLWNGGIRMFKDCTEDATIGPRLSVILKSHENLWAARACVHPTLAADAAAVRAATDGLLFGSASEVRPDSTPQARGAA